MDRLNFRHKNTATTASNLLRFWGQSPHLRSSNTTEQKATTASNQHKIESEFQLN